MKLVLNLVIVITAVLLFSCGNKYSPEMRKYVDEVNKFRQEKDNYMKNDPASPFNHDSTIHFASLKYYPVDTDFVFKSKLNEYPVKDTIIVYGTKGEPRKTVKYGYVTFDYKNNLYKINVYKGTSSDGEEYYSIWFTDKTTGGDTYGVGRYIDFDINPDSNYVYTIDFNLAYNPYCAYSARYSCAIPTREDYLNLAITAGEKKFH
ncbi:MAG TPA: DUF1684 domain-containing protein [Ignavibacteriaceae bacterium]|nr:DUF1684 domain-containing protein [Ignavibacteriaceae bacterium]